MAEFRYRYEINMVAQPDAVTLAELRSMLEAGKIDAYCLCWKVGESEPVFETISVLLGKIRGSKRGEDDRKAYSPFVSVVDKPVMTYGRRLPEYFQKRTPFEVLEEALAFLAQKELESQNKK